MKASHVGPIKEFCVGIFDGPHATPSESDDGAIYLGIKNLSEDGRLDLSEIRYVSENDLPKWIRRVNPQSGDLVFTYEATLHRYAIIPEGFRGCLGRRVALVRPDTKKVDSLFLLYYFLSARWRQVIESNIITGATVDRIPIERFPNFPVSLPDLPVQKRIADIISAYDEQIDNNLRRITLLEESAKLLYEEWFVRLRFPGHEHTRTMKGVPEGWENTSLGDVCGSIMDGDWIESKDQGEGEIRLVQISNIGMNEFVETNNFRFISQETFRRLRCTEILENDILIARMPTPIGRGWLATRMPWRMVTAVDVAIIKPNPERADSLLLTYFMNSAQTLKTCEGLAAGATRPRITRKNLVSLPFLLPPKRLQAEFREVAAPIHQMKSRLRRQNDRLREARDILLPKLMSGEISITT